MSVQDPKAATAQRPTYTNPRRTAPEFSVSLRHPAKALSRSSGKASDDAPSNGDVSAASRVAAHGGGPTPPSRRAVETRNAEKWFDESNNNAGGKTNVRFIDDDPPFYLPKQRSSDDGVSQQRQPSSSQSDSRPNMMRVGSGPVDSAGSSIEEYRSVIDDLTIENQELKRRLRKYEGMHAGHLQDDKLFEVRVYKLSQARRRRLESMLRDFVAKIARSPPDSSTSGTHHPFASLPYHYAPAAAATKRSGSSASNKPVDSAYASMSQSGPASVSQAQPIQNESSRPIRPAVAKAKALTPADKPSHPQDQRVQSYLQNMSRRLLPKYPPVMTEKTKKRLIVKRLEQLFVGRTDSSSNLSQSHQQQEVSQSAANADRRETEAMGHRVQAEGRREAKMLRGSDGPVSRQNTESRTARTETANNGSTSMAATPDQRPTRPLDLDPSRAHNPTETISYMKHLGFNSPKMNPSNPQGEQEGWIYLNLLINMAQLHTLNVTPGFVRNAIQEVSTNFELSEDGQNIRWKGGPRMSKLSSDSSMNSDDSAGSPSDEVGQTGKQQSKARKTHGLDGDQSRTREKKQQTFRQVRHWLAPQTRFGDQHYSPLFYNPDEGTPISPTQEGVSSNSIHQTEDRSGGVSGDSTSQENTKTSSKVATDGETGTLIFYQRARFYTDLKGDPTFGPANTVYEKLTEDILGTQRTAFEKQAYSETKGAFSSIDAADVMMADSVDDSVGDLGDFQATFTFSSNLPKPPSPAPLNTSGLGGVTPQDNFCIAVLQNYRNGTITTLRTMEKEMEPTPLPPPLYAFLPYSSSSSDTEDSDDEDDLKYQNSIGPFAAELNETQFVPPTMLGEFSSRSTSDRRAQRSQGPETSDGSSLDMLEFARKADPDSVARQEREYEAMRTRSTDTDGDEEDGDGRAGHGVLPAGSVAATIGDRSTFLTSQEDNASIDERHRRFWHERKTSSLKRERSDWGESQRANKQTRVNSKV